MQNIRVMQNIIREFTDCLLSLSPLKKGLLMMFIALLMVAPWLGLTQFNTKGEPREAVVSLSMIQQKDLILPTNNDTDIPYKPMMYHWTGALFSLLNGGATNEFLSRLPSALAFALLIGGSCMFFSRYGKGRWTGMLTSAILMTCFELHRSGISARVDMTLTFWMVSAFYLLYRWRNNKFNRPSQSFLSRIPWGAIFCMSAAILSKGPVGFILPCLATGIYMLFRRDNFFKTAGWLLFSAVMALILPSIWYYLAWKAGGHEFLDLVMEENFGRMTGTMTYESHSNPWHYNFWITAAGFLPWTLLALAGGFLMLLHIQISRNGRIAFRLRWKGSDLDLFSLISLSTIIFFFCLPSSKRSVYLMPAYPFIAWFTAKWFIWLGKKGYASAIRFYGSFLAIIFLLIEVVFIFLQFLPEDAISFSGKHGAANQAMMDALQHPSLITWITTTLLTVSAIIWFLWKQKLIQPVKMLGWQTTMLFFMFVSIDAGFQPLLLNAKSLKQDALNLKIMIYNNQNEKTDVGQNGACLYEFIEFSEKSSANKYHFFELDFYLEDKIKNFRKHHPANGYLALPIDNVENWLPVFEKEGYVFEKVYTINRPARKEKIDIFRFSKKNSKKDSGYLEETNKSINFAEE